MKRLLWLATLVALVPWGSSHAADDVTVYAHRGGAGLAPENTLGAFRQTWAAYGDDGVWLELDTQLAADGKLVVIHDATLDRTTDCTGNVIAMTSDAMQGCDARGDWAGWPAFEPVPTMRAVLEEGKAAGWRVFVELKNIPYEPNFDATGANAATALVALLDELDYPAADVGVQSFFPTSLDQIQLMRPDIATALLTTSDVGFLALENAAYATARGYDIVAPDTGAADLTAESVGAIHALGKPVVVWTPDSPADIARAVALGVDGMISNYPDRVLAALG
jgi:glycerophosphoryl diester phosphodiesterase